MVVAVQRALSVHIEPRHDGDGLVGPGLAGVDEAKRGLAGTLAK